MLARATNPNRNDTECQEDSQGNSLAAGVEQGSDDVELTAESLDETDGPTQRYGQRRVRVLQKKVRRGEAKNQTRISMDKGKSKECKTRLP